jgi:hypothetical protein
VLIADVPVELVTAAEQQAAGHTLQCHRDLRFVVAEDHLPGAVHLPLRRIETEARTALDPSRPVVMYCWDLA